jgi:hypothetical protein
MIIEDKEELEEQVIRIEESIKEIKKLLLHKRDKEVLRTTKEMITDSAKQKKKILRKLKGMK